MPNRPLRRMISWLSLLLIALHTLPAAAEQAGAAAGAPPAPATTPASAPSPQRETFRLTWLGHAGFLLETPAGTRVMLDPPAPKLGYPDTPQPADLVLVSHPHFDHAFVQLASGSPESWWGIDAENGTFLTIRRTFRELQIHNVSSAHDTKEGKERGLNSIWVVEAGGLRFVHLGDLGSTLSKEQVQAIGPVDVLLVPVGGTFTLDGAEARKVVGLLAPRRLIVPMHDATRTLKMKLPLASLKGFLTTWKGKVRDVEGATLELAPGAAAEPEVVVFRAFR